MEQYTITSPFKHEETFFSQFETEDKYISKDDCKQVYSMMILDMWICILTHTQKMASFIQFCDWYTSVMWPSLT